MKLIKFTPKKNAAQAIVEFAIVLPILLLLLYGLLEAGRLLFIYSSVVTASRQAARYGSATGQGGNWTTDVPAGPNNSGISRYQDCYGIQRAARRADFLKAVYQIDIAYDNGQGVAIAPPWADGNSTCDGTGDANVIPSTNNTTRIVVTVRARFTSLVPKIVPFFNRDITATSARTILMSITIPVGGGGGGGPAAATNITITPSIPQAQPGEAVTFTVTVASGTGTPTGTVDVSADGLLICNDVALTGGVGTCTMTFPTPGTKSISATYAPDSGSFLASGPTSISYVVGPSSTTTTISGVSSEPSLVNNSVTIYVRVENQITGGPTPTGTVVVSTSAGNCSLTLSGGVGSCDVTYTAEGWSDITATYTPGDLQHLGSASAAYSHQVLLTPPTPSNTPVTPVVVPTTPVPATPIPPTPVTGCNSIRDKIAQVNKPIKTSGNTMYLDLPNTGNPYPVVIRSVFVAWNYAAGHVPGDSSLYLQRADLNGTVFWTGNISKQGLQLPISVPLVIPANGTARITFTFDKIYNREEGEQIQIQFATPGCEAYPVILPAGAPVVTPIPSGILKLQLKTDGTDTAQQSQFRFQIQNPGSIAISNISVRIYFTVDGTNAPADYVLEKYWDQSGVATVSGPTLASGNIYYFTIDYGATPLPAGGVWEFQTSLHLSSWGNTYIGTNDWWHTAGALPGSYTDWTTIPVYVSGITVWGGQP